MADLSERRRSRTPRARRRRIHDSPILGPAFDTVLLSISDQVYGFQGRKGSTLEQLAEGTGLSGRGLLDIFKTTSDPKISTLVRIAHFFGCELVVSFRRLASAGTALR